jgi:hypothetical protein
MLSIGTEHVCHYNINKNHRYSKDKENMFYFNIHINTHRERKYTIYILGRNTKPENLFRFEGDNNGGQILREAYFN